MYKLFFTILFTIIKRKIRISKTLKKILPQAVQHHHTKRNDHQYSQSYSNGRGEVLIFIVTKNYNKRNDFQSSKSTTLYKIDQIKIIKIIFNDQNGNTSWYLRILNKLDGKGKHKSQTTSLTLPNLSTMTLKATVTLKFTIMYDFFFEMLLYLQFCFL